MVNVEDMTRLVQKVKVKELARVRHAAGQASLLKQDLDAVRSKLIEIIQNGEPAGVVEDSAKNATTDNQNTEDEASEKNDTPGCKGSYANLRRYGGLEAPPRLVFEECGIWFYVDFAYIITRVDESAHVKGALIYGALRRECFTECPADEVDKRPACDRTKRCDAREDKPLLLITMDCSGRASTKGVRGSWQLGEGCDTYGNQQATDKGDGRSGNEERVIIAEEVARMHCQALDSIFDKALEWTAAGILP